MGSADHGYRPSRADRKRADQPFQELARRLAALTEDAARALPAPEELREEILAAICTRAHGARNRQIKRLAALLRGREEACEALGQALAGRTAVQRREVQDHKELEALRERLCDPEQGPAALEDALRRFPALDRRGLQRLARAARDARGSGDRRAYREIFRRLRRARDADGGGTQGGDDRPGDGHGDA